MRVKEKVSNNSHFLIMKRLVKVFLVLIVVFLICSFLFYKHELSSPSNIDLKIEFEVNKGDSLLSLANRLKSEKLIRSEVFYKIYIKLNSKSSVEAGTYYLNTNMDVPTLVDTLSGKSKNNNVFSITFKEGKNMRSIASLIASNTEYSEEDFFALLEDKEFLNELIKDYWFLTDEILNEKIYYSLEGYLYPETYEFNNDASLKDIIKRMLDEMDKVLLKYKSAIENSNYSVHEILTLASIIELESAGMDDKDTIASVFYNRLNSKMPLGSDVTTYYAVKVDMSERDLYKSELEDYNAYNTRSSKMAGILPVSPICNPSVSSISASINPSVTDYYYFVADKYKNVYFSKTYSEHTSTVAKLKKDGLWIEY